MKQLVVIMLYGIALMNLCSFSIAETTPGPDKDCMIFKEISSSIINLSWNSSCFNESTIYEIKQIGDKTCTKSNYPCTDSECNIDTIGMNCFPIGDYIKPCQIITYSITGNFHDSPLSRETIVAPLIKSADWNLNATVNDENKEVVVSWGPPSDTTSTDVECATNATVSATCAGGGSVPDYVADELDPPGNGTAILLVGDCKPGEIIVTVTYMLEIPTESKKSTPVSYKGPSTAEPSTTIEFVTFTTDPINNGTDPDDTPRLSPGETAGIVIGSIVGVALIALSIAFCYVKKKLCFE